MICVVSCALSADKFIALQLLTFRSCAMSNDADYLREATPGHTRSFVTTTLRASPRFDRTTHPNAVDVTPRTQ